MSKEVANSHLNTNINKPNIYRPNSARNNFENDLSSLSNITARKRDDTFNDNSVIRKGHQFSEMDIVTGSKNIHDHDRTIEIYENILNCSNNSYLNQQAALLFSKGVAFRVS